ncbi:GMC family oxidoreductase N-terminal domain-containing protein [Kitasatospora sp. NBC_01250]|uniref:GMC family oxidoreductase n=1 Tax=Kitasatospora sp. NBC_01250 TaxID=2903571 RepID=UPI002E312CA5|nr:GMC family oxidoreductase N-terminal domain-containing protein [Kitasatospora sp. NBC_01250]
MTPSHPDHTDIVIGAGSTGAVIAARLSEHADRRVLLIEAGPDYPDPAELPAPLRNGLYPAIGTHDWGYTAEAVPGRTIGFPRGKVVGGTSAINVSLAMRPEPLDFEAWTKVGNEGWTWEDVLPYYVKLEDDQDFGDQPVPEGRPRLHGAGGPIPIWRWQDAQLTPQQKALQEAAKRLGFPEVADHNAPGALGVGPLPQNLVDGQRISTAIGYLAAARSRPNLTIRANTTVDRILFEGTRAVGVRVVTDGVAEELYADRITLSAGTVATPAILLRSGIGAPERLAVLGVAPVAELPGVGENFLDHCTNLLSLQLRPGVYDEATPVTQMLLQFTAPGSAEFADMQLYVFSHVDLNGYGSWVKEPLGTDRAMMFSVGLELPRSVGHVTIDSTDPEAKPIVVANYLQDPEDLRKMREGLRLCWELARQPEFRLLTTGNIWPGAEVLRSDEVLDEFLQKTVITHFHPVGTAKMGPADDPTAVVDDRCRVHGTTNLRVADASVMPVMVRSNTNLTCIMIGERVADWLLDETN